MDFHTLSPEETLKELHSNAGTGLSTENAEKRLKQYGCNSMPEPKKKGLLSHFFSQFADFMILVLVIAAGVSFLASMLEGKMNLADPLIILAIIILNACLGVFQEHKAEQSLEALKKLSAPDATVLRDGKTLQIPAKNLVPGDIIYLEAGSFVPADARLLSDVLLKADESALTGESVPIEKHTNAVFQADTPMAERTNLVYSSSVITSGRGTAVVTHTGLSTQIGTIAQMIMEDNAPATPLQKKLSQTGKILGIAALCICVVIFILGVLGKRPVLDMFLTSVSLAVAAIPEGLPSIVTIMLSIGVQRMAKNNAVIRKLPVVETLGNATVICSDKTGTLTQNKMTVTKLYTKEGEEDFTSSIGTLALSLGVLCNNSHTANIEFGDPMELALLSAAEKNNIYPSRLRSLVRRQGEFPFDSTRKCMTVICFSGSLFPEIFRQEKYISITKGAPDVLLPRCAHYYEDGRLKPLSRDIYQRLLHYNQVMASKALRVIAITCRNTCFHPRRKRT